MADDKVYKEKIDNFFGGVSDDIRTQALETFAVSQNFDIWTNPKRLTPFQSTEVDEVTTYRIELFMYGNSELFGYGRKSNSATVEPKVFQKPANNPIAGTWEAANSGESTVTNAFKAAMFLEYHFKAYGSGPGTVWAWGSIGPSGTFTDTAYTTGSVVAVQGLVTSDDKLLVYANNQIHVKDGAGSGVTDLWSLALELPLYRQITDSCEYGDLVAVAVHPGGGYPPSLGSRVYLWDKVSDDVSQTIDWGDDHCWILDNIDGVLVGVSVKNYGPDGKIRNKIIVREWSGGTQARVIFELEADAGAAITLGPNYTKVRDGSTISFALTITIDGVSYLQMATVGRKSSKYPISFTMSRLVNNGTVATSIDGAFKLGDYWFFAINGDGSVKRTNDNGLFGDAYYITQRLTGESKVADTHRRIKQLLMAGLIVAPLPSGATAKLYYRVDSTASWALIRSYTTTNGMGFEAGVADTAGDQSVLADFLSYKELQFKAISTGGAEITGIVWAWKIIGADIASE